MPIRRLSMPRILAFAAFLLPPSVALSAVAQDAQTFYLAAAARAGKVQLPRGICQATWSHASGPQVQLRITTDDGKTITVPARMVKGRQERTGVVTSVVNGVTYLDELDTRNAKFIFQNSAAASR